MSGIPRAISSSEAGRLQAAGHGHCDGQARHAVSCPADALAMDVYYPRQRVRPCVGHHHSVRLSRSGIRSAPQASLQDIGWASSCARLAARQAYHGDQREPRGCRGDSRLRAATRHGARHRRVAASVSGRARIVARSRNCSWRMPLRRCVRRAVVCLRWIPPGYSGLRKQDGNSGSSFSVGSRRPTCRKPRRCSSRGRSRMNSHLNDAMDLTMAGLKENQSITLVNRAKAPRIRYSRRRGRVARIVKSILAFIAFHRTPEC